jgi:hypothetical protein
MAGGLPVKQFLLATFNGRKRLFAVGSDGALRLYEEGVEDDVFLPVAAPYTDVLVNALPAVGNTIQVNGGTVAAAINSNTNAGANWGCDTLADARANLWVGYQPGGTGWTNASTPTQIDWGVRFTGTTTAPIVTVTGSWAFVDLHQGLEITSVPIVSSVTTRGYLTAQLYVPAHADQKRFLAFVALLTGWAPSYNAGIQTNGVSMETDYATAVPRSNLVYDLQGQANWDPSNINDDHPTPKRQDYSIVLPDLGFNLGASGVAVDLEQFATERVPVSEFGVFGQVALKNTSGRVALWAVLAEAEDAEKLSGTVI